LLDQALKDLLPVIPSISLVKKENKNILPAPLYVGMVESWHRRFTQKKIPGKINLYILDEAHIGNYNKVIDSDPDAYVIGLTATPVASAANEPLNKRYGTIVCGPPTQWMVDNGFLIPSVDIGHNEILRFQTQNGEFTSASQMAQFSQYHIDKKMLKIWQKIASDRHTICYNINIEHNKEVYEMVKNAGIETACIDYNTHPDERRRVLGVFKKGHIQFLCNVGIVGKGYDSKMTSCIVLNTATTSLSRYRQWIGRGARPYPDQSNFYVIDMGNNILRHGSFNDHIDWEEIFKNDSRDKSFKIKRTGKCCPICYKIYTNIFVLECDICGCKFKENPMLSMEDTIPVQLQKPVEEMTFEEKKAYGKLMGYKPNWAFMQHFSNKKSWKK
jgi:superfamily II DNA or RNA helicase